MRNGMSILPDELRRSDIRKVSTDIRTSPYSSAHRWVVAKSTPMNVADAKTKTTMYKTGFSLENSVDGNGIQTLV